MFDFVKFYYYLVTSSVKEHTPIFLETEYRKACVAAFVETCERHKYKLMACVIMPAHFHTLVEFDKGTNIVRVAKNLKGVSSRRLSQAFPGIKALVMSKYFWTRGYNFRQLDSQEAIRNAITYIKNNPVKRKLNTEQYSLLIAPEFIRGAQ